MNVGITGNIGSGKSTVCQIFETLGIPTYYADVEAKKLMTEDPLVREQIKLLFGVKAYTVDGILDRKYIGDIVFNNPQMLSRLNYIVHPAVKRHSSAWAKIQKKAAYTLKEAALLIESNNHEAMDKIIVVTAPLDLRVNRVMERDGATKEEVMAREQKQMDESKKVALADFVINNDGSISLVQQVHQIHQKLMVES